MKSTSMLSKATGNKTLLMAACALFITCLTTPAFAQGGMGGAVGGILLLVLGVIGVIAFLFLILIWRMCGPIVTSIIVLAIIIKFVMWTNENAKKDAAQHAENAAREQRITQRCLSQGEEKFNIDLAGTEKIRFSVSETKQLERSNRLDPTRLPADFSINTKEAGEKQDASIDADIDVLLTYSPGTIDADVKRVRDGAVVAHRRDVSVESGFCLGPDPVQGIAHFLRKALNRPDFYNLPQHSTGQSEHTFHYIPVVAVPTPPISGQFEKAALPEHRDSTDSVYTKMRTQLAEFPTCSIEDMPGNNNTAVTCLAGTVNENKFTLKALAAVAKYKTSWFTLSQVSVKNAGLGSLLIEQRDMQGKPLSAWIVNFLLPSDSIDRNTTFKVSDVSLEQKPMKFRLNWKRNVSWSENYDRQLFEWLERQTTIYVNLPELQ